MSDHRWQSGTTVSTDCDTSVNYNEGCGTAFDSPSYGTSLNAKAGGWYVMRKSREQGVSVWFWARDDPSVPYDVRDSTGEVWPRAEWGLPDADFPTNDCEYDQHFDAHQLVFDLTFCVSAKSQVITLLKADGNIPCNRETGQGLLIPCRDVLGHVKTVSSFQCVGLDLPGP
jgi:hypothetical protein